MVGFRNLPKDSGKPCVTVFSATDGVDWHYCGDMHVSITKRGAIQFEGDNGKGGYFAIAPEHVLIMDFEAPNQAERLKCYDDKQVTGVDLKSLEKAVKKVLGKKLEYER